ncbi:hydrogenase small subunit [Selenomonas sp. TAMA-11512]|uniref:hydrogenase small subunit n=1 Tax=Selenomonas sp. TAMA-11512 TaxID=3095337 RepID=UPI0030848B1E|nr:hydrogenase small subunit [Selenomonas sp. TAMA-11512]
MEKRESMWDYYLRNGMSRRSFLKGCVALTSLMGLSTDMVSKVVEAAETNPLPVVIWLHGHECTGCDESFIRSAAPMASDLILSQIALEYDHLLSAASGAPFEEHLEATMEKYKGKYILAVEGAVATKENGVYCMSGGHPFLETFQRAAENAACVIAYGTCATSGGIQAAKPNPTGSAGIGHYVGRTPVVNVPGCPPIPEVMTGVVMHVALFGKLPELDLEGRPKQFFGNRIHDTCYRRPFFDAGMFAERFDDAGAKGGWCLYKLGCRGPETYASCGNLRWFEGMSYPIQSGAPCIGCTNAGFWDNDPLYERLPEYPPFPSVDKIGAGLAVATVAGVAAHGAASLIQRSQHEKEKAEEGRGE